MTPVCSWLLPTHKQTPETQPDPAQKRPNSARPSPSPAHPVARTPKRPAPPPHPTSPHPPQVSVEVTDRRASLSPSTGAALNASRGGPYNVTVLLRGVGVSEMNTGPAPVIGVADALPDGGPHVLEIPCPRTRTTATVRVEVTDGNRWAGEGRGAGPGVGGWDCGRSFLGKPTRVGMTATVGVLWVQSGGALSPSLQKECRSPRRQLANRPNLPNL